ncbi:TFIIB-type zinc ribbon-containing protein [Haladaptatus sp. DJG-WS-42]|uniref:DUF7117 family protein n=1 Tax=Haladaptatus sp. DJG-WS-42 TaxID=3120516 RepID=UPI0030CC1150
MKIRGERECKRCGTQWSYYETGGVECPSCGSLESVGISGAKQHTATPDSLDLTEARDLASRDDLRAAARTAKDVCRRYVHRHGFINGGDLIALSPTYLAAVELRHVADVVGRALNLTDDEEFYFVSLLRGADTGARPDPSEVPGSLADARGLAYAEAVMAYRRDLDTYLNDHPDQLARQVLASLTEHVKRVRALEGDIAPENAERLVGIAQELGTYLRDGDESALATAQNRLASIE